MTGASSAVADHPLRRVRRKRGLTLADLPGLSVGFLSMVENGQWTLMRLDHIQALAAALRVSPAEIAPSTSPALDERVPLPLRASAFPPTGDEIAVARHERLARQFMAHVASGDTCAAGMWLRRTARDPSVNPWLLLDQLTMPDNAVSGPSVRPSGGAGRVWCPPTVPDGGGLVDRVTGETFMCGTIRTARQASAGEPAIDGYAGQPGSAVRIPPLADPQGNDVTGRWPLRSFLELGALPSAVPCARLHTRQLLWEWQLTALSDSAELLVSEITTNAVQITQADGRTAPVRLWLLADHARLLILIWDASPLPPVQVSTGDDAENGRGLLLDTLSTRWDHFPHHSGGKVTWALLDTEGGDT